MARKKRGPAVHWLTGPTNVFAACMQSVGEKWGRRKCSAEISKVTCKRCFKKFIELTERRMLGGR